MNIIKAENLDTINWISHGFFDRTDGFSSGPHDSLNVGINRGDDNNLVLKNRAKIAESFGVDLSAMVILNQTHSGIVHIIDESNINKYKYKSVEQALKNEGDAIITKLPNLLIGVNTADCAPILLCDTEKQYIAAIHSGWRGTIGCIIENTVEKLKMLGCSNLVAAIGPCVNILKVSKNDIPPKYSDFVNICDGDVYFNMARLIIKKLTKYDVSDVLNLNINTISQENFFSYRRLNGVTGVQFSGIIKKA